MVTMRIELEDGLHRRFKVKCVEQGVSMAKAIMCLIRDEVDTNVLWQPHKSPNKKPSRQGKP